MLVGNGDFTITLDIEGIVGTNPKNDERILNHLMMNLFNSI